MVLCADPWGAIRRPASRAAATSAAASAAERGRATAAGRWSWSRLKAARAASQSASSATMAASGKLVRRAVAPGVVRFSVDILVLLAFLV